MGEVGFNAQLLAIADLESVRCAEVPPLPDPQHMIAAFAGNEQAARPVDASDVLPVEVHDVLAETPIRVPVSVGENLYRRPGHGISIGTSAAVHKCVGARRALGYGCPPDREAALALAALRLRVERLLGDARAVLAGLLEDPLALLRWQPAPDVEQGQSDPDRAEATRESEARHAPILPGLVTSC